MAADVHVAVHIGEHRLLACLDERFAQGIVGAQLQRKPDAVPVNADVVGDQAGTDNILTGCGVFDMSQRFKNKIGI